MKTFLISAAVFIGLGILANWFWFPEYLLLGISAMSIVVILAGVVVAIRNTIRE